MIDNKRGTKRRVSSIYNQEILLDIADFALQVQPEDNLMVAQFLGHGIMAHIPYIHILYSPQETLR